MSIIAEESAWLPEEVKADKNIFFLSFLLSAGKHNNNEEQSLCLMKGDQNRSHTLSRTLPKSCEEVNPENILLMKRSSSLFLLFYFCNLLIGKATIVLPSLFFLWVIHIQKKKEKEYFAYYISRKRPKFSNIIKKLVTGFQTNPKFVSLISSCKVISLDQILSIVINKLDLSQASACPSLAWTGLLLFSESTIWGSHWPFSQKMSVALICPFSYKHCKYSVAMNNREPKSWCCQEWVTQEVVQTYTWEHLALQFIKCGCVAHIYHFYFNTKAESTVFIKRVTVPAAK